MNANASWTAALCDRYAAWWPQAEPLIAERMLGEPGSRETQRKVTEDSYS